MFPRPHGFHYHDGVDAAHLVRSARTIKSNTGGAAPTAAETEVKRFYSLKGTMDAIRAEGVRRGIADAGVTTIGNSTHGRAMHALKIGNGVHACLITGCYHAREWISVEVPLLLAEYLVHMYPVAAPANEEERRIKHLLDNRTVYFVPMSNPDGHQASLTRNRLWRANTKTWLGTDGAMPPPAFVPPAAAGQTQPVGRSITHDTALAYTGVDINRNHACTHPSAAWGHETYIRGGAVTSRDPADCAVHTNSGGDNVGRQVWCGPSAASEQEVRNMEAFIGANAIKTSMHYHSCFGIYLYPDFFEAGGDNFTKWLGRGMQTVHAQAPGALAYDLGSAGDKLYSATGSAMDFSREASGNLPTYTPEVRPRRRDPLSTAHQFSFLPENQIWPTFLECLCPSLAVINAAGHGAASGQVTLDINTAKPAAKGQVVRNCWNVFQGWTYPAHP